MYCESEVFFFDFIVVVVSQTNELEEKKKISIGFITNNFLSCFHKRINSSLIDKFIFQILTSIDKKAIIFILI